MINKNYFKIFGVFFLIAMVLFSGKVLLENAQNNNVAPPTPIISETPKTINKIDLLPIAAQKAAPCIVNISMDNVIPAQKAKHTRFSVNIYKPLRKNYQTLGSGVIVSPDGYILTNNHVIESLAGRIKVDLENGKSYKAKLIGRDVKTDIAVIKIKALNLPCIQFADSDKARIGDIVLALGNPFGIGASVTMGIISAIDRSNIGIAEHENFIQTDAAINPGSSGGALVNINGELVGISTAILTKSGGYEGIGFAIPSNMALKELKELLAKE